MTETAVVTIDTQALDKLSEWIKRRDSLVTIANAIVTIDNDADLSVSGGYQTRLSKLVKELKSERLKHTRKIDAAKKVITDKEKELTAAATEAIDRLKAMNSAYATAAAAAAEEERRRVEAENRAAAEKSFDTESFFGADAGIDAAPEQVAPTGKIRTSANRIVTRWHHEVTDSAKVPRELCSPDDTKIRSLINHQTKMDNGTIEIPGVRVWSTQSVESR